MNWGLIGIGAAIAFAAIGSALGTGSAGMAAVGAWKKCFMQNRPAPFILVAFVGFPLSQTIYGYLLMNRLTQAVAAGADAAYVLGAGILGGIAIGMSAWLQGRAAASASDAMGETGKGTGNYIFVLGIIETVALFVMVFLFLTTGAFEG
ncbi:MAG: V-type ATP synthase subunit K [Spirochaetaceae bacterium]|nr:MAG: V-type ATP synthase subunit K [Spirochaetaceae bacterium]